MSKQTPARWLAWQVRFGSTNWRRIGTINAQASILLLHMSAPFDPTHIDMAALFIFLNSEVFGGYLQSIYLTQVTINTTVELESRSIKKTHRTVGCYSIGCTLLFISIAFCAYDIFYLFFHKMPLDESVLQIVIRIMGINIMLYGVGGRQSTQPILPSGNAGYGEYQIKY